MKRFKGYVKEYGYAFYLGVALFEFADVRVIDWQFYAIVVPIVILAEWSKQCD